MGSGAKRAKEETVRISASILPDLILLPVPMDDGVMMMVRTGKGEGDVKGAHASIISGGRWELKSDYITSFDHPFKRFRGEVASDDVTDERAVSLLSITVSLNGSGRDPVVFMVIVKSAKPLARALAGVIRRSIPGRPGRLSFGRDFSMPFPVRRFPISSTTWAAGSTHCHRARGPWQRWCRRRSK